MLKVLMGLTAIVLLPLVVLGQFSDDFSDGDFTQNPQWTGTTDKFIVENQMLRLNDDAPGMSYLATASSVTDNVQWEFWIRLAFTPSNNNHPRIYLMSDSHDLTGPLNGYYLRIGKDGTDNKRLYFYRQTGEDSEELMTGLQNIASSSNNRLRIKAVRDDIGNWEFWADPEGGELFIPQGKVTDNLHTTSQWFGVYCRYTVSNARNFYFDDFYVGDIIADDKPPEVLSVHATDSNTAEIVFSKAVTPQSAGNTAHYQVGANMGSPQSAQVSQLSPNRVFLSFAQSFELAKVYEININGVQDYSGNVMEPFSGTFSWYVPGRFDVVFNEVMANPEPSVGLPPYEYVEFFNTSGFDISMEGWVFQHGNTQRVIPSAVIEPGDFLVITHPAAYDALSPYGNVVAVPGLSTSALTNSGTVLVLYDQNLEIISWLSYSDQWYGEAGKESGGWSLEKIDPFNFCEGAANWIASTDPSGGTPGAINSVFAENPDTSPPRLLGAAMENPLQLRLYFSEPMEEAGLLDVQNYLVDQNMGHPLGVSVSEPHFKEITLTMPAPFEQGRVYEIRLSDIITDCAGNMLSVNTASFADYIAEPFDIVFNELMANPTPTVGLPAEKYLEVYNTSPFPLHLRGWTLTHGTSSRRLPFIPVAPGGYAVITTESAAGRFSGIAEVYGVPGLSSNFLTIGGLSLSLHNTQGELITWVNYSEQWYRDPSKASGGWSLEKIDPLNFCEGAANWRAAVDERGGTPGTTNSVKAGNQDLTAPFVLRAGFDDQDKVWVFFSESMDRENLSDPENYSVDGHQPLAVDVFEPGFDKVRLHLEGELEKGIVYEVKLSSLLTDCAGNALEGNLALVGVPEVADSLDLVINEILFNPPEGGSRYVEIYNRSQKIIDLQHYILSSMDTFDNTFTGVRVISDESHLIFPEDHLVLTPDPEIVKELFMTPHPLNFIATALPPMTNTSGVLVLASKGQKILDKVIYHEDMHYPLLNTKRGVSLERLNYHRNSLDRDNWHSASQGSGFGTPAYRNSQFTLNPEGQSEYFTLYPEVFSPDNDGVDDLLNIAYDFDRVGYTANITVYDSRGRLTRRLRRSELLATSGVITWDGTTEDQQKADVGIYVVFIELFNPEGNVKRYRKTTVLATKFQ